MPASFFKINLKNITEVKNSLNELINDNDEKQKNNMRQTPQ